MTTLALIGLVLFVILAACVLAAWTAVRWLLGGNKGNPRN